MMTVFGLLELTPSGRPKRALGGGQNDGSGTGKKGAQARVKEVVADETSLAIKIDMKGKLSKAFVRNWERSKRHTQIVALRSRRGA
jgi:hypothetical protein